VLCSSNSKPFSAHGETLLRRFEIAEPESTQAANSLLAQLTRRKFVRLQAERDYPHAAHGINGRRLPTGAELQRCDLDRGPVESRL
jgi:hypothetical protein